MAFIVPNATTAGGGLRYANINQSEPDSLDLEVLGNRANWLRSGGAITVAANQISVASGAVVINNVPYSFSASNNIAIASATDSRFDAVVVRLNTGASTCAVTVLTGTDSATNPTLPQSRSTLTSDGLFNASYHYDPATDVLLGTVYKVGSTAIASANVVDKRVIHTGPTTFTSAAVPGNSVGAIGDMAVVDGTVYIKNTASTWKSFPKEDDIADYALPIGAIFAWPSNTDPPNSLILGDARFKKCNGQALSTTTYADLYAVIGTTYGSGTGTFLLPKIDDDRYIMGGNSGFGTSGGANTHTLTAYNIPRHSHTVTISNHAGHRHAMTLPGRYGTGASISTTNGALRFLMAAGGTEHNVTYNSSSYMEQNDAGLAHTVTVGEWGASSEDIVPVSTTGKYIKMHWYIRVK